MEPTKTSNAIDILHAGDQSAKKPQNVQDSGSPVTEVLVDITCPGEEPLTVKIPISISPPVEEATEQESLCNNESKQASSNDSISVDYACHRHQTNSQDVKIQTSQTENQPEVAKKLDPIISNSSESGDVATKDIIPTSASGLDDAQPIKPKIIAKVPERKNEDEKLVMYKALAIKIKKELVKTREELQNLKETSSKESNDLRTVIKSLEDNLNLERQSSSTTIASLETKARNYKQELEKTQTDLQSIQSEFDEYKVMASQIMQQNNPPQMNTSKAFEEERYKQLKRLSEDQERRIANLESSLKQSLARNEELVNEMDVWQKQLEASRDQAENLNASESRCRSLMEENENLKSVLDQFRSNLKDQLGGKTGRKINTNQNCDSCQSYKSADKPPTTNKSPDNQLLDEQQRASPGSSSNRDNDSNNLSGSSAASSTASGYVHIKAAPFEIISRSSGLGDAQSQIDNLTKAYLDSESTNSLLTEQVQALKEEMRRIERGNDRMDLAENLEYLKNVVFRYISLDSSQTEQKKRLVPVLSTVLKLSPEEIELLNSSTVPEKPSVASSIYSLLYH